MKILLFSQFFSPDSSPVANLVTSFVEDRVARGDEVTVITSRNTYAIGIPEAQRKYGVDKAKIIRIWSPVFSKSSHLSRIVAYACYYLGALFHAITLSPQDAIVSVTVPPYIVFAGLLHKCLHSRTRVILWYMDVYPDVMEVTGLIKKGSFLDRLLRAFNRLSFGHIDHLISLDEAMEERLLSQYAAPQNPVSHSIIPTWERPSDFPSMKTKRSAEAFTRENPMIILYTGNAGWGHDFVPLIEAAQMFEDIPIEFHFTGGGKRTSWIKEQIEKKNLKNIKMHGYVSHEELLERLSKAHLGLITLRNDCAGIMSPSKLYSYLAMGLPVLYLGPCKSNVDMAILTGHCGFSLNSNSSEELISKIRGVLDDPFSLVELSENAKAVFSLRYTDKICLSLFHECLTRINGL